MQSIGTALLASALLVGACHHSASAADLMYDTNGTTGVVWSIGPDRINDGRAIIYDPTNGTLSRGDITYPVPTILITGTSYEEELRYRAQSNINRIGYGLQQCYRDNNRVPSPTLRSSVYPAPSNIYLTTPVAYVVDTVRATNYGSAPPTLEAKRRGREIGVALQRFYRDWNQYPDSPLDKPYTGGVGVLGTLTSPIAYLTTVPTDPYTSPPRVFSYQKNSNDYILWSYGPDGDRDISLSFSSTTPGSNPAYFAKPYDYNSQSVSQNGDIIYTSVDQFGESVWLDPFEPTSAVSGWMIYDDKGE